MRFWNSDTSFFFLGDEGVQSFCHLATEKKNKSIAKKKKKRKDQISEIIVF